MAAKLRSLTVAARIEVAMHQAEPRPSGSGFSERAAKSKNAKSKNLTSGPISDTTDGEDGEPCHKTVFPDGIFSSEVSWRGGSAGRVRQCAVAPRAGVQALLR